MINRLTHVNGEYFTDQKSIFDNSCYHAALTFERKTLANASATLI